MRMWMCDPRIECRLHLVGEWRELFTFAGVLNRRGQIRGYIENDLLEPESLKSRWDELRQEMINRGYHPADMFPTYDLRYLPTDQRLHKINRDAALQELISRCPDCKKRYMILMAGLDPTTGKVIKSIHYDWV